MPIRNWSVVAACLTCLPKSADARGGPVIFAGSDLAAWRERGQDADSIIADPMFANPAAYDFTVLPESPVWKLGWKKIDMGRVGPRVRPGLPAGNH